MFGHCLTEDHILACLQMIVEPAFGQKDEAAQFKLFSTVLGLQKTKIGGKKGCLADGSLWLAKVNLMANEVLKSNDETESLATHHRRILKYVRKEVTSKREELFANREAKNDPK